MVRLMVLVTSGERNGSAILRHLRMGLNIVLLWIPLLCSARRCPRLPLVLILKVVRLLGQLESMRPPSEPAMVTSTGLCGPGMWDVSILIRCPAVLCIDSTGAVLVRRVASVSLCVPWALVMLTSLVTVRTLLTRRFVVLTELVPWTMPITRVLSMFRERLSMVMGVAPVMLRLRLVVLTSVLSRASVTFLMSMAVVVVVLSCVGPGPKLNRLMVCLAAVSRLVVMGVSTAPVVVIRLCSAVLSVGLPARLVSVIG